METKKHDQPAQNPFFWPMLQSLPYFRALLRAVEAYYYQDYELPGPVLDVGAGDGHFASVAFKQKLDVGLDPEIRSLREAQDWGAYKNLLLAEGARMPFADGHFASAISNSVLEHIPGLDAVLAETSRVLRMGAPFLFCVPNSGYYRELGVPRLLPFLRKPYEAWFAWISRTQHAEDPEQWEARLSQAGFSIEAWWHYFPPAALRALDWGHYFSVPAILPRLLTRRWLFTPARWNLGLTARLVERYADPRSVEDGAYSFYVCRKR